MRLPNPRVAVTRWRDFRREQREMLLASNRPGVVAAEADEQLERSLLADLLDGPERRGGGPSASATGAAGAAMPTGEPAGRHTPPVPSAPVDPAAGGARFGEAGRPINRHSPFYIGFIGALGALVAISLWNSVGRLTATITILLISLFLTLALNPLVEWLTRRSVPRAAAVGLVFLGLLVVFTLIGWAVIPPVVTQSTELAQQAPSYLQQLLDTQWIRDLDQHYQVVAKFQEEFNKKITDQTFIQSVLGGILGAGAIVASGIFQALTVLILTLYFLSSLPAMKQAAYAIVPASRRLRVVSLSEEIMRRTGSYAIGQVAIAAFNAVMSWIMMSIVGIPYAVVLAVAVGFLGLIPMVGATLGASVVSLVAFFDEPRKAIIAIAYYVIYQQVENYLFVPKIMQRTVSVPGAVTVVAALTGGTLLGVLGALLAIPVAAGLLLIYDEVIVPRQRHQ